MPYESTRNRKNNNMQENASTAPSNEEEQKARQDSSKKVAKTAAKGAANYFAGPIGGKAVDALSKTKVGDALLNKGGKLLNSVPGVGKAAKKLDDRGAIDKADQAMDIAGGSAGENRLKTTIPNQTTTSSGVSSGENNKKDSSFGGSSLSPTDSKPNNDNNAQEEDQEKSNKSSFSATGFAKFSLAQKVMFLGPLIILLVSILSVTAAVAGEAGGYEDGFGANDAADGVTDGTEFTASSREQNDFYTRINDVKSQMLAEGKSIDVTYIIAMYQILVRHNAHLNYDDMTTGKIEEFANSMLLDNRYNEETFKNNVINQIIPQYLPNSKDSDRERMVEEMLEYVENYYDLVGADNGLVCASLGSCIYTIHGFYIPRLGNVTNQMNISDLKVRLMQTGFASGHNYGGTFGLPLEGEELVPFEKYILGVAYQEIGPNAPEEALKAQMVAARSYALARAQDVGGWNTLQEENGQWILQIANSTNDQVYCDPDQGCSSNDGQWGQIHSGLSYDRGFRREPMPADSRLRTIAAETMGEVLVNDQGNVIYAGYKQEEQDLYTSLARQGLNYKQILLEVYNNHFSYGASNVQSMNCNKNGSSTCSSAGTTSTGDFANWKQYEGPWTDVLVGTSGKTIRGIGCLATSVAMLIAKSKVPTVVADFNPGTFVEFMNTHGGFSGGSFTWTQTNQIAPGFVYQGDINISGYTKQQKLDQIKALLNEGAYVVAEVKGGIGQHWVAIDSVVGDNVIMMDPGSSGTILWQEYDWNRTSRLGYYKVQ